MAKKLDVGLKQPTAMCSNGPRPGQVPKCSRGPAGSDNSSFLVGLRGFYEIMHIKHFA